MTKMKDDQDDVAIRAASKIFGDMLRRQRQKSQWMFRELAEKTEVEEDIISQLEAGEPVGTEIEHERLCEFLGLPVDTFAKLIRNQRALLETTGQSSSETMPSNVVKISGYRNKWAKTTTHPEA
ncbi:helix-turn-helix domain-containing protein [Rhizobiales bacterium RZME27]|uniref:Helix-turn-helix domain-containing protein n=2 Tax=Endobacterium cereale TaxID=2663029 RepID=A0A6A8AI73_9HYPH|nr:helix-turn-helix domain-containing protein [Endobacterium cereale]